MKFPDPIPWDKEYKLINEGGFFVYARKRGEYLILEKQVPVNKVKFELLEKGELPQSVQMMLRRRINNIVSLYSDQYQFSKEIRGRLERISATLPKHQAKFISRWMDEELTQ